MSRSVLRHLDREPYDHETRERLWARIDRRRLESSLPAPRRHVHFGVALAACVLVGLALLPSEHLHAHRTTLDKLPGAPLPTLATTTTPTPFGPTNEHATVAPEPSVARPIAAPMQHDDRASTRVAGFAANAPPTVEALFAAADAARATQRPRDAVAALERIANEHPTDPRAAIAMLTAARIQLDTLDRPAAAAHAFERALALGLSPALVDDARARAAEARARTAP